MDYDKGKLWRQFVFGSMAVWAVLLIAVEHYLLFSDYIGFIGITIFVIGFAGLAFIITLWRQNIHLVEEIQDMRNLEKELRYYSYYDAMAGTYNRNAFVQEAKALEGEKSGFAVILCDIDGLKLINDTLGHSIGDHFIQVTAEILTKTCSMFGRVYRMGGDEFLVFLPTETSNRTMMDLVQHIRQTVASYSQYQISLSISIGWALADNTHTLTELIKIADCQMYQEKAMHREQVRQELTRSLASDDK